MSSLRSNAAVRHAIVAVFIIKKVNGVIYARRQGEPGKLLRMASCPREYSELTTLQSTTREATTSRESTGREMSTGNHTSWISLR